MRLSRKTTIFWNTDFINGRTIYGASYFCLSKYKSTYNYEKWRNNQYHYWLHRGRSNMLHTTFNKFMGYLKKSRDNWRRQLYIKMGQLIFWNKRKKSFINVIHINFFAKKISLCVICFFLRVKHTVGDDPSHN